MGNEPEESGSVAPSTDRARNVNNHIKAILGCGIQAGLGASGREVLWMRLVNEGLVR
jgi:hypothetical protein